MYLQLRRARADAIEDNGRGASGRRRRGHQRTAGVLLALFLATPALADLEAGVEAFARQDYETAHREWAPLAAAGNPDAQFSLGVMYMRGLGVEENPPEAARWIRLAAEQGRAQAQFTLGVILSQGLGAEVDPAQAARWYRMAALQGESDAQIALGLMLVQGSEGQPNFAEAAHWFRTAAADGNRAAFASLGLLFEAGRGVPQNDVCAYAWFNLAAAGGNEAAREKRDVLRASMVAEQVARGQFFSRSVTEASRCPEDAPGELVGEVRQRLQSLGYLSEHEDDAAIDRAVRAFQAELGLRETGRLSDELLMLLRQKDK